MTTTIGPCILVAGIGNILLGDDGFGVEVARRLSERSLPAGVTVRDFGIRGMDLAYALLDPYDAVLFVDTASREGEPGTLYVIEPEIDPTATATIEAHGMDPVKVLALARAMGAPPVLTYLVGCEPGFMPPPDSDDVVMELTEPVRKAVNEAVEVVESLIEKISVMHGGTETGSDGEGR